MSKLFSKGDIFGGRCEKCGYVKEDRPQCALPDDYVLGQHYAVGRVITQDDVMITYLAQDLRTEKIYALRSISRLHGWCVPVMASMSRCRKGQMQNLFRQEWMCWKMRQRSFVHSVRKRF